MADVLVVGAGAAGLFAAKRLGDAGLSTTLVEVRERVGGRAWTVSVPGWRLPVELGAEFVHDEGRLTRHLAAEAVLGLGRVANRHQEREKGSLRRVEDPWSTLTELLAKKKDRRDYSGLEFLRRVEHTLDEGALFRQVVEGFDAAPLEDVSIESLRVEWERTSRIARLKSGHTALFRHLLETMSRRVEVRLGTRVDWVRWGSNGVEAALVGPSGAQSLRARFCVVTVPLGLLGTGGPCGVRFEPPVAGLDAKIGLLGMGQVMRVVLRFAKAPWGGRNPGFVHDSSAPFPTVWGMRSGEQYQVTAWAGGRYAGALAGLRGDEIEALALRSVRHTLDISPFVLSRAFVGAHHHDFRTDPASLGAYSYARPGAGTARRELAKPVGDALFFAGEATDEDQPGTVEGALSSGDRAARQVLDAAVMREPPSVALSPHP